MSYGLLKLNDHHIEVFDGEHQALATCAQVIIQPNTLITGADALAQLRINPTLAYSKHWQQLDQRNRALPNSNFRHHADLAYHQLGLWLEAVKQKPLIVSSSFAYSAEQYALLAGLLHALQQKPISFCDSALLLVSGYLHSQAHTASELYFLDLTLHSARLIAFQQRQGQLVQTQQWEHPDCGCVDIQNTWLKNIAQACIRQTRYDPLHSASSEQKLYTLLPKTLEYLATNDAMELDIDGRKVELHSEDLRAINEAFREKITAQIGQAPLLLSETAYCYSSLTGKVLTNEHLQQALALHADYLTAQSQLKHHTQLALTGAALKHFSASAQEIKAAPAVSHLLNQHLAHKLISGAKVCQQGTQLFCRPTGSETNSNLLAELILTAEGWHIHPMSANILLNGAALTAPASLTLGDKISATNCTNNLMCIALAGAENGP